jgi:phosphoglycerol transferase MdoB-like AlkP superfamily enzyme
MQPTVVRPAAATALGVLAYLVAFLQMLSTVAALVLWLRPGQVQEIFSEPVSDWYWVVSAVLSMFLFFAYIWLARGILSGRDYAWTVVNLLALINLFFGLLYLFHGTGLLITLLSALVLALNNLRGVRDWYATD